MTQESRASAVHPNIQVNSSMIIRGGEYFNRRIGFGFYEREIADRLTGDTSPPQENIIWLPSETKRICDSIDQEQGVLIEGGLGSGKSALMYGIRAVYRENDRPYTLVDGHYMNAPVDKIDSVLKWAKKKDALLLWDSFDYLPSKSRKVRKGPVEEHVARTRTILQDIGHFIDAGGKFVATSHTQPWLDKYGDPALLENEWATVTAKLQKHTVVGRFEKEWEVTQFYEVAGFSPEWIQFLTGIQPEEVITAAEQLDTSKREAEEICRSFTSYRIAKLLALDPTGSEPRERIQQNALDSEKRPETIRSLVEFIRSSNAETKKRMGAVSIDM